MDKNKIRNIIGVFCILGSLGGMSSGQPLPSLFILLFGISLLPAIYQKISFNKIKNPHITIPIIVFVLFIITISIFGNSSSENIQNSISNTNKNNNTIYENSIIEDKNTESNKMDYTIDVPSFNNITYNQLVEKMGQPTDTEPYKSEGKEAKIYFYNNKYEFIFYNDKLIRLTIYASEFEELKSINNIEEFCKKLNIKEISLKNKFADTGYALRYKNLTSSIKDFWITSLDDSEYIQIKITFETNGFNI